MATKNLFDKAKKEEKLDFIEIPELENALLKITEIDAEIERLTLERNEHDALVRETSKNNMINLYNNKKTFPGTLKVVSGAMSFQFITADKYKKVDKESSKTLSKMYGNDIVEESTTYSMNPVILERHKDHISKLIMGSKVLSKDEKENIIVSNTTYNVKKGTIKDLFTYVKDKVNGIIEDIQPQFTVKGIKFNDNLTEE